MKKLILPFTLGVAATIAAGAVTNQGAAIFAGESPQISSPLPSTQISVSPPLQYDPNVYVTLAKRVMPSVVNISTTKNLERRQRGFSRGQAPDEFFDFFFGGPNYNRRGAPQQARPNSLGSGFVIDPTGIILTNNHVVADADSIKITFTEDPSETPTDAKIIARDPELDVALIKVNTKRALQALPLGDSDTLEVGEFVAAAGNPFGRGHSISSGIISAKNRPLREAPLTTYLQTDAPINPGNSGGPLVNLKGEVIGVNTAIDARAQGIGFAIPISLVKSVLPQLKDKGTVERGFLGVAIRDLNEEVAAELGVRKDLKAPLVQQVDLGTPAYSAGIRPYDLIVEFNGQTVRSSSELMSAVASSPVGESVQVKVLREGKEKSVQVKLGKRSLAMKFENR